MCGLWASVGLDGGERALEMMLHRGPDGGGIVVHDVAGRRVTLGNRRLAVIDLSARADLPMTSTDGRLVLAYNGEIYNHLELRETLATLGHRFRSESDSEVLLTAYQVWGAAMLPRLTGMFAFAILDRRDETLFLARDPFGIKPLYFVQQQGALAVASEITPLLDCPGVSRRVNPSRAQQYLVFGLTDHGQETMFADVQCLPAAHHATIDLANPERPVTQIAYWRPQATPVERPLGEAAAELRGLFLDSLRLHLRSDVTVGAALSGGIDSAAIVAGMRAVRGAAADIDTFSLVAPGSPLDEDSWARNAAEAANARRHTVAPTAQELRADLDALVRLQGEPFGSTSIYGQYRVMRLAGTHGIKVLLDGQGGDELFAGYRPYLAARLADLLREGRGVAALRMLGRIAALPGTAPHRLAVQALGRLAPPLLRQLGRQLLGRSSAPPWLDAGWFRRRETRLVSMETYRRGPGLHDALMESLTCTVLPALLRYEDRNAMHFSIEARVPFLTTGLVEAAYACPSSQLIAEDGTTKAVFRDAMRGLVPDTILARKDKIGFATPEQQWLVTLSAWVRETLESEAARRIPFLDARTISAELDRWLANSRGPEFQLWRFLNFIMWSEALQVRFE